MNRTTLLTLITVLAVGLAGCANNGGTTTTTTTPTTTTPTPPTDEEQGPPEMLECEGDYEDEDATGDRDGLPELSFAAKDPTDDDPCYAFVGPRSATAGWTVFTLGYPEGMEFHIMPMYFIGEHSLGEVMAAFATQEVPEWAVPSGAVGGVTPGQTGSAAVDLQEGSYLFFCPINGHMFKGMMGILNVTAADEERNAPAETATITLEDFNFTLPASLSAGAHVIKVVNGGTEPHEAPLARLDADTTMMQFLAATEDPNATGPPPGALIGGLNTLAPGQTAYILVMLEAGARYGMACFVESDAHDGAAHLALGMVAEFDVTAA